MAKAYLKIKVEMGRERAVRDALLTFEEVKAAELTTGDQDVLALVEADSYDDILQVVIGLAGGRAHLDPGGAADGGGIDYIRINSVACWFFTHYFSARDYNPSLFSCPEFGQ